MRDYLSFLIGGGGPQGIVCLYLVVDGKVVREAGGDGGWVRRWLSPDREKDIWADTLKKKGWDVREFVGQEAVLRMVDYDPAAWLMIDQMELTDEPLQPVLRFAQVFTDNLVLQQQKPARIWGWAKPGAEVTVTLTEDEAVAKPYLAKTAAPTNAEYAITVAYIEKNAPAFRAQSRTATADARGAWRVELAPQPAGFTPKFLVAQADGQGVAVKNVLLGELWVCAGQSNMKWPNFNRKDREAASADFPGLRYMAWNDSWSQPLDDLDRRKEVKWEGCSPRSAEQFSAVPYLFIPGRERGLRQSGSV